MKRTGEILKKAREEKRLSLHEVALFLKINSRVLQAIEDGDQAQLPARTFLRGFIQSYAKFLKLDPNFVLQIFAEENAPPVSTAVPLPDAPIILVDRKEEASKKEEEEAQAAIEKEEIDVISLEKSILTKSQVAQDKLGLKTIAVSIVGLLLVVVLYFANSVVKKYQKEAQVAPVDSISSTDSQEAATDTSDEPQTAPTAAADTNDSTPTDSAATPAAAPSPTTPAPTPVAATVTPSPVPPPSSASSNTTVAKTPVTSQLPVAISTSTPNSVQPHVSAANNPLISPITLPAQLPTPIVETKPKVAEKVEVKPVEKPIAAAPVPAPAVTAKPIEKPATLAPTTPALAPAVAEKPTDKKEESKPEGKLIEVIVEANDAVEIEYSSSKTSPQKMVLKAEQIHTFKSRSGVRLKISNGGAVNIIMNGRDLGAPGAAGQPIQVTY